MYTLKYRSEITVVSNNDPSLPHYVVFNKNGNQIPLFGCNQLAELVMWLLRNGYLIRFWRL
jgi:hypothetical protein